MLDTEIPNFLKNTTLIKYNSKDYSKFEFENLNQIVLNPKDNFVRWMNTFGNTYFEDFNKVIVQNNLDDFLNKLILEDNSNKVIELDNLLFVSIRILKTQGKSLDSEEMYFILNTHFIWSVQEKVGDYFEWIRDRLSAKKGMVRSKNADYLFFLILESIIDNYEESLEKISKINDKLFDNSRIKPTPEFTAKVEESKQEIFKFRRATIALRDTITKLEKVQLPSFRKQYFSELKEQINNIINDVDFELQELDSKTNLIYSIQGYYLNEVMKTLTIFSVVFIPLTFLAGIYGMNFKNIPELNTNYGYFIVWAVMLIIAFLIIFFFKRKKWF